MPGPGRLFRGLEPLMPRACLRQRLVDILDDVGGVLDADRKPDGLGQNARHPLLFGRHLAVGGRSRMTGERFRVADIDQPGDQLQRIVERLAGLIPPLMPKVNSEDALPLRYFWTSS